MSVRPEDGEEKRNEYDAGTSYETGVSGSGVLQACSLKAITREHKEREAHAGKDLAALNFGKYLRTKHCHEDCGNREAHSQENKRRGMIEAAFDDDKGCAPNEGAEHEREIGFEFAIHVGIASLRLAKVRDSVAVIRKLGTA